jgi:2-polyprenyl-3-methyl-5-hydroxy-6-metoxy-1,4-benzoquinol methylase
MIRENAMRDRRSPSSPCKICGSASPLFGVVDFNKNCAETKGVRLPVSGAPVYYRKCSTCGFVFTDEFDDWSHGDYEAHIYNQDYVTVDPDYVEARPRANAQLIGKLFGHARGEVSCLDYGGGNGKLAELLREAGFARAETFDDFHPEQQARPAGPFNLVTCFEVFEHTPDPKALVAKLSAALADPGLVLFSTLLQPVNIDAIDVSWWYIGPRNGHISIHSKKSLATLLQSAGLTLGSFNEGLHIAYRMLPEFAASKLRLKQ